MNLMCGGRTEYRSGQVWRFFVACCMTPSDWLLNIGYTNGVFTSHRLLQIHKRMVLHPIEWLELDNKSEYLKLMDVAKKSITEQIPIVLHL